MVFNALRAAFPSSVVSVTYAGVTVSALRSNYASGASLTDLGEQGKTSAKVLTPVSTLPSEPANGATITVAGKQAFVMDVQKRGELIYVIEYQLQKPNEAAGVV